jgi:hypothetical protein
MTIEILKSYINSDPLISFLIIILGLALILLIARNVIARGLIALSSHTKTKVDDILVKHIKPLRVAWLAPLIAIYLGAGFFPTYQHWLQSFG